LLVCLADTDAGCLVVAAQSGAKWRYSLLLLQVVLIPILFLAQELTVRLGVYARKGQTACIRDHFGCFWAWFACSLLVVECICAMTSEMSGVVAVAELWGVQREYATFIAACAMGLTVFLFDYRQIEVIGVTLGLFELTFVFTMVWLHPDPMELLRGAFTLHRDSDYWKMVSANIGAVIMPWMIYFQQSAVVARRLTTRKEFVTERNQTLFGSINGRQGEQGPGNCPRHRGCSGADPGEDACDDACLSRLHGRFDVRGLRGLAGRGLVDM